MIRKIWLREYGPFREAEFSLSPLTVLVGPNASGKTMAMEALRRVKEALDEAHADIYRRYESHEDPEVLEWVTRKFFRSYGRRTSTSGSRFIVFNRDSSCFFFSEHGKSPIEKSRVALPDTLPIINLLKFEPESLRSPSYLDADELAIRANGYGLATILADMKLQDDERLEWIESQVKAIIPNFERVRLKRAQVQQATELLAGNELIFDMTDAPGLSPNVISDGTILVLGIVTSVEAATRKGAKLVGKDRRADVLVLIDDIERGLHPRALNEFVGCLRRMTEEMNVQILATSHSPYLLDSLKPGEVRLTGFLDDSSATICELSDHPEFERWKDVMSPGEFWSTAGEGWIRDVKK